LKTYKIAAVPGDGISHEIIKAGIEVLKEVAQNSPQKITVVAKSNTLINSLTFWSRVIKEVADQYADVALEFMYIDNCTANFILRPEQFDVVLTTNLFGDILSDLGGSGNINPEKEYPSMFESIHGSAPDIAEKGIANPIGTIWSGVMMLDHLGEKEAADNLMKAIDATTADGI